MTRTNAMDDPANWFNLFLSVSQVYAILFEAIIWVIMGYMVFQKLREWLPPIAVLLFCVVTIVLLSAALFDQNVWRPDRYDTIAK